MKSLSYRMVELSFKLQDLLRGLDKTGKYYYEVFAYGDGEEYDEVFVVKVVRTPKNRASSHEWIYDKEFACNLIRDGSEKLMSQIALEIVFK